MIRIQYFTSLHSYPFLLPSLSYTPIHKHTHVYTYACRYIDLDKVLSVEKDATEKDQERPTFSIFCEGRTFQMQTDDETTMEQ